MTEIYNILYDLFRLSNDEISENEVVDRIEKLDFDPDEVTDKGHTPLIVACMMRLTQPALALIRSGVSKPDAIDNNESTALIYATENKLMDVCIQLITNGNCKPEQANILGNTALINAISNNMPGIPELLLRTNNSNPGAVNYCCYTALQYAIDTYQPGLAIQLIQTNQSNPFIEDDDYKTALDKANEIILEMPDMREVANELMEIQDIIKIDRNKNGFSAEHGDVNIKEYLEEDSENNFCFIIDGIYYLVDRRVLLMQQRETKNLSYRCRLVGDNQYDGAENLIGYNYQGDENLDTDVIYFDLKSILPLQSIVERDKLKRILFKLRRDLTFDTKSSSGYQIYIFDMIRKANSIMSLSYYNGTTGDSANKCQPGGKTPIYTLRPVKNVIWVGKRREERNEEPLIRSAKEINVQYANKTYTFPVTDNTTLADVKDMLLNNLIETGIITTKDKRVRMIIKGKIYETDLTALALPFDATIQVMISDKAGGKSRRKKKKCKKRKTKRSLSIKRKI